MLKKAVQQGRRRVETAEEVYSLGYVEDFDEPRARHGNKRVSARQGLAGEKSDVFRILLG